MRTLVRSLAGMLLLLWTTAPALPQQTAWELHMAAGVTALQQDTEVAEREFEAALQEAEKLGPLQVAQSATYLALACERQDKSAKAELLYARGLAIREKELGPQHPEVATSLEHQARLLAKLDSHDAAREKRTRAAAIRAKHIEEQWREQRPGEPFRVSEGGTSAPRRVHTVDPEYSEDARIARLSGRVELSLEVWPDGRAHNFRLREGLGLGLDEKAIEAISQWRFEPAMRDGTPVVVEALVTVHFRLL